jgi:hypothetical protein
VLLSAGLSRGGGGLRAVGERAQEGGDFGDLGIV